MAGTRMHSERDSSSEDEDTRPTKGVRRTARSTAEAALVSAGSAMGLMGDLFRDFQAVLDAGVQLNEQSPPTALTYRQRKYRELFHQLSGIVPWVVDEIAKRGPRGTYLVARDLEDGRMSVRGSDLHGVKKAIVSWDQYNPVIPPDAKSVRGFNHPECGRLLCPVIYDWSDPEVRRGLQNGSRKYPAGAQDWPLVLWKDEQVDLENLPDGFLRNLRLIKAGRYSLLGPRSASQSIPGKSPARKPKAKVHRIRSITIGFIAYTAVLVHCSLSSQESFGDGTTAGTFPYEQFYQSLVRYVEETMTKDARFELLRWWTLQIFGIEDDYFDDDTSLPGPSDGPRSVMERMKAQEAARAAAVELARGHAAAVEAAQGLATLAITTGSLAPSSEPEAGSSTAVAPAGTSAV
ncbi:hypothetical protein BC628DRAFT_1419598 [Trametes gibbosa]|nr:hypothetical protein BC628DRAFT_1419598 [Trametes gibbosa]